MTKRTRQRLRQIVGRDTRVIRSFLGVIEQHENQLLTGKNHDRIDDSAIDKLTMTATRVKSGAEKRLTVLHDFKVRFLRISQNELNECRQTAVAIYESYLALRKKMGRNAQKPCHTSSTRRIPRWVFSRRFKLVERKTSVARWWLNLRDSLDSVPAGRRIHDKLRIPLKMSPFHLNQLGKGIVKALQIFTDRNGKWWTVFAVRLENIPKTDSSHLPQAVLGIDLGIKKAVCTALLTPQKVSEVRYFKQKDKIRLIQKYDRIVAELQHERNTRNSKGMSSSGISKKLKSIRNKRENLAREYDRVLVRQILDYIRELNQKFHLYVAVGRLKGIRTIARRNPATGRQYRGMIHRWAFSRITKQIQHGLSQLGWSVNGRDSHVRIVPEAWTSIMCWKCGHKGIRPKQNLFICPTCGNKCNTDKNGAINIAGRLVMLTDSLHSVRGLGKWANAVSHAQGSQLNAHWEHSSQGKSIPSSNDKASCLGGSAAVCYTQKSVFDFNDKVEGSNNDPAVEKIVEILSVAGNDALAFEQEKEARSEGGMPSQ